MHVISKNISDEKRSPVETFFGDISLIDKSQLESARQVAVSKLSLLDHFRILKQKILVEIGLTMHNGAPHILKVDTLLIEQQSKIP